MVKQCSEVSYDLYLPKKRMVEFGHEDITAFIEWSKKAAVNHMEGKLFQMNYHKEEQVEFHAEKLRNKDGADYKLKIYFRSETAARIIHQCDSLILHNKKIRTVDKDRRGDAKLVTLSPLEWFKKKRSRAREMPHFFS